MIVPRWFKFVAAAGMLSGLIGFGVWIWSDHFRLRKFHTVAEGVLYRCATQPNDWCQRRVFEQCGARTIVILRSRQEMVEDERGWYSRETKLAADLGARIVEIPMDYDTPPDEKQIREFLALVDDPAARPVIFHCEVGVIRTGAIAAVWRMEREGWSPEQACREYEEIAGRHATKPDPKRQKIREFILNYRPHHPASQSLTTR